MVAGRVGSAIWPGQRADWTFIVGIRVLAAVPTTTPPEVVAELAAVVTDAAADVEAVVSRLPLTGDGAIDDFAVVVPAEAVDGDGVPVTAVVRGDIVVDMFSVGGSRRFAAEGIRPWLLAEFQSVVGIVIGSPRFTVVPADRLHGGAALGLGPAAGNSLFWSLAPGNVDDTVLRLGENVASVEADTVLRPWRPAEDTIVAAGRPGRSPRGPAQGDTDLTLRHPPPRVEHYGFRLPGGPEQRLDEVCYLGRRPRPPRSGGAQAPRLVTVDSQTSAVSKTHLEIRQEGDSVVVTDLGSTNGTVVIPPRGRMERLRSGQSLTVVPGTTVDIGDGNIIEILPVGGG